MAERMFWRRVTTGALDWCYDHHEGSVRSFDENPDWERVHVLTEAELAQHDTDLREQIERNLREQYGLRSVADVQADLREQVNAWGDQREALLSYAQALIDGGRRDPEVIALDVAYAIRKLLGEIRERAGDGRG